MMYKFMYEGKIVDGEITFTPPTRVFDLHLPLPGAPNIFAQLSHNVTFATDDIINAALYEYYERWFSVYVEPTKMRMELETQILKNGDYWEKLYQTMLLEFNPLHNYDMTEVEEDHRCRENQGVTAGNQTSHAQSDTTEGRTNGETTGRFGYNSTDPTDTETVSGQVDATTGQTSDLTSRNAESRHDRGRECGERTLTRQGNIGVTTSSQLLTEYRGILLKILDMYVQSFSNLFMVL